MNRKFTIVHLICLCCSLSSAIAFSQTETSRVLYEDHFEAMPQNTPDKTGVGTLNITEGKTGKALALSGLSYIQYNAGRLVDLNGGQASFWVTLNFDPYQKNEQTKGVLRNQIFLSFKDSKTGECVSVYTTLEYLCLAVTNSERNLIFVKNVPIQWEAGKWHHIALKWGKEIELWLDDKKGLSGKWDGLFGPLPTSKDNLKMVIGFETQGIDSLFSIDELVIKGAGEEQVSTRPILALPLLNAEPVLDGQLTEDFWKKTAKVSGFVACNKSELMPNQPILYAAYTNKGLYLGLEALLPEERLPRTSLTARDASLHVEDCLEIFLQPPSLTPAYYQLQASANGTQADSLATGKTFDARFNPDWKIKTQVQVGKWFAEIFIPFESLNTNMPKPGELWRGNFCLDSATGFSYAATWAFTSGNFHDTSYFGQLLFTGQPRTLRIDKISGFSSGQPLVGFTLEGDFNPVITVKGELFDATGKKIFDAQMPLRDAPAFDVRPGFLSSGYYTLKLYGSMESGQDVFYQSFGFTTLRDFSLTAEHYPYAGYLQIDAVCRQTKETIKKVTCTILSSDDKVAGSIELTEVKPGISQGRFNTENLASGDYRVKAEFLSIDDKAVSSSEQVFKIFPKPIWWKSKVGTDDHSVPLPFTPITPTPKGLSFWGREYLFDNTVFPRQIVNQQVELFHAPVTLNLKTEGKTLDITTIKEQDRKLCSDEVVMAGREIVGNIAVDCKTTTEFDGMSRFDITLSPMKPTSIEEMKLVLPIKKELAGLMLTTNGKTSSTTSTAKGFASDLLPCIWLGNDDIGIAWFAESDQYWKCEANKAIEVLPGEKDVVLKINFITSKFTLEKPITFTFGLMASPVKPIQSDPFCYMANGTIPSVDSMISFPESLAYPESVTIPSEEGTIEFWCKSGLTKSNGNNQIFHIMGKKENVGLYLLTPQNHNTIALFVGSKKLFDAAVDFNSFTHLAIAWDKQDVCLYVNGNPAGKTDSKTLRDVLESAGHLRFGCSDDYYGFTDIIIDDVRVSKTARYDEKTFAVPQNPFQKDEYTILLDNLDETFKPDGQDAETHAGGIPTIGGVFMPAKFDHGLQLQVGQPCNGLDLMKEDKFGITVQFFWQDYKIYGWPPRFFIDPATVNPGLKEANLKGKKYGISAYPYVGFPAVYAPSDIADQFGNEWCVKPLVTQAQTGYTDNPNCYYLYACNNSKGYVDYLIAGTAWAIDEYGFSGSYTDGTINAVPCQNLAHGCGYIDDKGNSHSTWPIFAARETLKRLYRIVKARNPEGLVINHQSFNMLLPAASFTDICYTGEHEDYEDFTGNRLRYNGMPWGIYTTLLGSSDHKYSSLHTAVALMYGTCIWHGSFTNRGDSVRKEAAVRKVYEDFSYSTADWVPYFKAENNYYKIDDDKIKASMYYHHNKSILLIVGNFNDKTVETNLDLDLGRFGLEGKKLSAINGLTKQPVVVSESGLVKANIKPKTFMLIEIERIEN